MTSSHLVAPRLPYNYFRDCFSTLTTTTTTSTTSTTTNHLVPTATYSTTKVNLSTSPTETRSNQRLYQRRHRSIAAPFWTIALARSEVRAKKQHIPCYRRRDLVPPRVTCLADGQTGGRGRRGSSWGLARGLGRGTGLAATIAMSGVLSSRVLGAAAARQLALSAGSRRAATGTTAAAAVDGARGFQSSGPKAALKETRGEFSRLSWWKQRTASSVWAFTCTPRITATKE